MIMIMIMIMTMTTITTTKYKVGKFLDSRARWKWNCYYYSVSPDGRRRIMDSEELVFAGQLSLIGLFIL